MTQTKEGARRPLPDDAELALLTEYVGGFMDEAGTQAFEDRLRDDEEFFARMSPMLDAWCAPGLTPAEDAYAAFDERRRAQALRAKSRASRRRWMLGFSGAIAAALMLTIGQINGRRSPAV